MEDNVKVMRVLRRMYPDRSEFSEEEKALVGDVLAASMEGSPKSGMLPTKFVGIGGLVEVGGYRYRCIERPRMISKVVAGREIVFELTCPADVCLGCDFSIKYRNCSSVQCSYADRRDRRNVWFVEVADE